MTPTPEMLALAREITADAWSLTGTLREAVLAGEKDNILQVQCTLAAIQRTTELAEAMAIAWRDENRAAVKDGDDSNAGFQLIGAATECNAFAKALRNGDHLKGTGQ